MAGNTPTWETWRVPSSSGQGLFPSTIKERQLQALASIASGQNPNGTPTVTVIVQSIPLAVVQYAPASQATYAVNSGWYPYRAIDATNITVSFVVPTSGNFYVQAGVDWGLFPNSSYNNSAEDLFLGLGVHGSNVGSGPTIIGYPRSIGGIGIGTANPYVIGIGGHTQQVFYVKGSSFGLAPGQSLQLDLVGGLSSVSNITAAFYAQNPNAADITTDPTSVAEMLVFAA